MTNLGERKLAQLKAEAVKQSRLNGQMISVSPDDLLALIALAETATPGDANPWRPTHRHLKSGGDYRVLLSATLEADRSDAVVYDDRDGTVWVRSAAEFYDGRFAELASGADRAV